MFAMLLNGKQVPVPACIFLVCRSNLMDISVVEKRTDGSKEKRIRYSERMIKKRVSKREIEKRIKTIL